VNNQMNHYNRAHMKNIEPTKSYRSLCERELYAPANYDNDTEMKRVMQQFEDRTSQRFHEYDERMQSKRMQCKEQCDKEIQKIILKDKLEKQMEQQLTTLETKIDTDDIPTGVCEKSLADKVEKTCLKCAGVLGGGITPGWGLVSGLGYVGWTNYITEIAIQKGIEEGVKAGIEGLKGFPGLYPLINFSEIKNLINPANYDIGMTYVNIIKQVKITKCVGNAVNTEPFCNYVSRSGESALSDRPAVIAKDAAYMAELAEREVLDAATPGLTTYSNAITASVVAILVIVLVMIIIYLILRYRRKKKMKKKLEYIKLLKE
ncbi:hypothetical protein PFUGPA_06029, partial [Plasmodium falciparum Palo Alto/Uganda]